MANDRTPSTAPGANRSLIASIVAFLIFLFANFASTISIVPMVVAFLIAPSLAFIAGIVAIYYAVKSLQYIRQFRNSSEGSQEKLSGKKRTITAIVISTNTVIISLIAIIVFSMFAHERRATPNKSVGEVDLHFYGDDQHREIAVQTILLPDSNLLTAGYSRPHASPDSGSGMLIKTDIAGNELWSTRLRGTMGRVTMLNDSTILNCRIVPYPPASAGDKDTLVLYRLNLDGEVFDTLYLNFGAGASLNLIQPIPGGGAVMAGVSNRGEGDYKGRSYLFKTDGTFAKQSLRTFPMKLTGTPSVLAIDGKGDILIAGFTDENVVDSTGTTEKRSWALTKISKDGDLVWNKPDLTEPDIMPVDLNITAAGEIYMLGLASDDTKIKYGLILRLDAEGNVLWSKRVTGEEAGYVWPTSMLERPGGWIVTGWISKRESLMKTSSRRTDSWMTYYISLLNTDGEIEHQFHGGRVRFEPWGILSLSDNSWIITGMGSRGNKRNQDDETSDKDIGLMRYSYKP